MRWLNNRLPANSYSEAEQQTFVRDAVRGAASLPGPSSPLTEAALHAYLRRLLTQRIGGAVAAKAGVAPPPVETAIGADAAGLYERSLASLSADDQRAGIVRLELGFGYGAIASQLGKPDERSARAAVTGAIARLTDLMTLAR